jgi:hypothetical protein
MKLAVNQEWSVLLRDNLEESNDSQQSKTHEFQLTLPRRLIIPWPPDLERNCRADEVAKNSVTCSWVAAACARLNKKPNGAVGIKTPLETDEEDSAFNNVLVTVAESSLTKTDFARSFPLSCSCSAASQTTSRWLSEAVSGTHVIMHGMLKQRLRLISWQMNTRNEWLPVNFDQTRSLIMGTREVRPVSGMWEGT